MFIIYQLWLTSHPRSTEVPLDTRTEYFLELPEPSFFRKQLASLMSETRLFKKDPVLKRVILEFLYI